MPSMVGQVYAPYTQQIIDVLMPIQLPLNKERYESLDDVLCLSGRLQQMRWNHAIKQVHAHQF